MKRKIKRGKGVRHKAKLGLPDLENAESTQILIRSYDEHRRAHPARAIRDDPDTSLATSSPEPQMQEARADS
jgi:hypothetical protein